MFGVNMRNKEDLELCELLQKELALDFQEKRQELRTEAAKTIAKMQQENCRQFNKNRKHPRVYTVGEMVAIQRTKHEKGGKFRSNYLGPYEVTRVMRNERYQVHKLGFGEGPMDTSVPADRMKPWTNDEESDNDEGWVM